jgi:acyl-CoA thioester hydrolase
MISIEQLSMLPVYYRKTIPADYLDVMGHMNVRWYMTLFDEAAWQFFISFGMDRNYYEHSHNGAFALKHFIRYLAEVNAGETVAVRIRVLGRSTKRVHFMHFLINETTGKVAATMEALGSHADLAARRTSPFPNSVAATLDALIAGQNKLGWDAPLCGVIQP